MDKSGDGADVMESLLATDESSLEVTSASATEIYIGPFRCYWEDGNLWAIDRGDISTWATYPEVYINCPVATRTQPTNDNVEEPRAWVEGYGVISVAGDGAAFIYAHR